MTFSGHKYHKHHDCQIRVNSANTSDSGIWKCELGSNGNQQSIDFQILIFDPDDINPPIHVHCELFCIKMVPRTLAI